MYEIEEQIIEQLEELDITFCKINATLAKILMRFKNLNWIAGFYLFSPIPLSKNSSYKGKRYVKGLFYHLSQLPILHLIRKYADMVWVTNELDRVGFIDGKKLVPTKVVAIRGGVDFKTPLLIPEPRKKRFDAIFIGRLVPEKGVLELIS